MKYWHDDMLTELAHVVLTKYADIDERIDKISRGSVAIDFRFCDKAKKKGSYTVNGDCYKVPDRLKDDTPFDFIITFYEPNTIGMTTDQLELLMYHELLHVDYKLDANGDPVPKFRQHDIEDFRSIVSEHGIDWAVAE